MQTYFYHQALSKASTKRCEILGGDGELIGEFQRYFPSIIHSIVDSFFWSTPLIISIKGRQIKDSVKVHANREMSISRKPYYHLKMIEKEGEQVAYRALQINRRNMNSEFAIEGNHSFNMLVKKDSLEWVRFYEEGEEVARLHPNPKGKFKTRLEISKKASVQSPLFYAVYHQLLYSTS